MPVVSSEPPTLGKVGPSLSGKRLDRNVYKKMGSGEHMAREPFRTRAKGGGGVGVGGCSSSFIHFMVNSPPSVSHSLLRAAPGTTPGT